MRYLKILEKPHWAPFAHIDGLHALPMQSLLAADHICEQIILTQTTKPSTSDYSTWALSAKSASPRSFLKHLKRAFSVILPSEVANVSAAISTLEPRSTVAPELVEITFLPETHPDPCRYRPDARKRSVSVYPWELPEPWQACLRRAARGLPNAGVAAPSASILDRMCRKLCQLAFSAQNAGLPIELSEKATSCYLNDLLGRLDERPHGVRWATMRATVEELHRFARFSGHTQSTDIAYLSRKLSRYTLMERGQDALKFSALLATGNTTLSVLDKADELLGRAQQTSCPKERFRLRNASAILGLYTILPLRNADANLIFGRSLIWEGGTWIVQTQIQKTQDRNAEELVVPLEPEFARFVDIVLKGNHSASALPRLREAAIQAQRPLFVQPDGSRTSPTYVPRYYKKFAGTSLTTSRTMLHTDQAISRGEIGTRDTMVMAHQTSAETAKKYQAKSVHQAAVRRVQDAASIRRSALMPDGLKGSVDVLTLAKGEAG